jgi:hypothetical protein
MKKDNSEIVSSDQANLLDDLQELLKKQIASARNGCISSVESMSRQADVLVRKIAQMDFLNNPDFETRRKQLQKLYNDLCLAITAEKDQTEQSLSRIRKGKKTVATYRNNI